MASEYRVSGCNEPLGLVVPRSGAPPIECNCHLFYFNGKLQTEPLARTLHCSLPSVAREGSKMSVSAKKLTLRTRSGR